MWIFTYALLLVAVLVIASTLLGWLRYRWLAGIGCVLALVILVGSVAVYFGASVSPTWILIERSAYGDIKALVELNRRMESGAIQQHELQRVFEIGLDVQGDASAAWTAEWGEFMARAIASGNIEAPLISRFLMQGIAVSFRHSPDPAQPGSFVFAVQYSEYRTGDPTWKNGKHWIRLEFVDIAVADQHVTIEAWGSGPMGNHGAGIFTKMITLGPEIPPGEYPATARFRVSLFASEDGFDLGADPIASVTHELECVVDLDP